MTNTWPVWTIRNLVDISVWVLRGVIPPAKDNQQAADFLSETIGTTSRGPRPRPTAGARLPARIVTGHIVRTATHEGLGTHSGR